VKSVIVLALLLIGLVKANKITSLAEDEMFADEIVYTKDTPYQRIVITRGRAGFQLFLNGNLQFSSTDEYRYHEALVHPAMLLANNPKRVLVLGGGDGLAMREILKYPSVERVTLVDLDPAMTQLSSRFPLLAELNKQAFKDPRVQVVNEYAFIWVEETTEPAYDAAIVDFPDPNTYALGKLYTTRFYRLLRSRIAEHAAVAVQSTSPMFARNSYWCIIRTLEAAGFVVKPYYTAVPSFGLWGFALARSSPFEIPRNPPPGLKFLDDQTLTAMFTLSKDIEPVPVEINRLDNQALVRYYEGEWKRFE
jgi:spermidine synthase